MRHSFRCGLLPTNPTRVNFFSRQFASLTAPMGRAIRIGCGPPISAVTALRSSPRLTTAPHVYGTCRRENSWRPSSVYQRAGVHSHSMVAWTSTGQIYGVSWRDSLPDAPRAQFICVWSSDNTLAASNRCTLGHEGEGERLLEAIGP